MTEQLAIYRRYRATTFGELRGQDPIAKTLRRAVADGRLGHGLLFVGPRGTGKTSTARIVAKALNCLAPTEGEPCGTCRSCVAITAGATFDVVESNAATSNRIDDVREDLIPLITNPPTDLKRKVLILDEVHRFTNDAWDALLKWLEEPPPGIVFIFCTTDPSKIRPAVLSRLQRFDFRPIALGNIALLQHFLGGLDEAWFILIHVDIERRAGAALAAGARAQTAISSGDDASATVALSDLGDALDGILSTMQRMPESCDPYVYYHRVRPYIFGWHNNPALPGGLVYEGVTAYAGKPQTFRGETGAQSTIVPCLDAVLGVEHAPDELRTYLMQMRRYMPTKHVGLLEAFEAGPTALSRVVALGKNAPAGLVAARNRAVDVLRAFRALHLEYAATYINRQAAAATGNPTDVGTGGTPFMKYLKKHRDETESSLTKS